MENIKRNICIVSILAGLLLIAGLFTVACQSNGGNENGLRTTGTENGGEENTGDFILTISVEKTTVQQGQDIEVTAVFKNQSGKRHNIGRGVSMTVPIVIDSEHYQGDTILPASTFDILEIDGVITETRRIGSLLPKGKHTLVARAGFDLLEIEDEKVVAAQPILVESNRIILTVN